MSGASNASVQASGGGVLRVAVDCPLRGPLDYLPPTGSAACDVATGVRVRVPLGRATRHGVVVGHAGQAAVAEGRLRRVAEVLDHTPLLTGELLGFLAWVSDYHHHPIGEVMADALPGGLRAGGSAAPRSERRFRLLVGADTALRTLPARAPRQAAIVAALAATPPGLTRAQLGNADAAIRSLVERGLVEAIEVAPEADADPDLAREPDEPGYALTPAQRAAVQSVATAPAGFAAWLLEGVTGSGKTEVYLQLIRRVVEQGRQALLLIPEIGLTPQTASRLRARLPGTGVVLHSALSAGERLRAWRAAHEGRAQVVIGTRSAIFAPLPRLGLVVVDEEHDLSYKQQEGLRYSARDLAVVRAHRNGVPVLLGTATPSLESLHNVDRGRYRHLSLPARTGPHAAPQVQVVDVRSHRLQRGLSPALVEAVGECLASGEQAILFLNRRGYAPVMMCHACGWLCGCEHCDAHLVYHRADDRLRCHHCDAVAAPPATCPSCGASTPRPVGLGTQRIAEMLAARFPAARIARVDRDSTRTRGSLERLVDDVHAGRVDVLVGTQMLAKGHHFPSVTLVAVVDADGGLFSADFRAAERMAQLIVQVAGRAGRGDRPGRVILQTHHPEHPLLRTLVRAGYPSFARQLLAERAAAGMPPFAAWALLRAEAEKPDPAYAFLHDVRAAADTITPHGVTLLGPVAAPMERRAGRHRVQLLLDARERGALHALLRELLPRIDALPAARRTRWSLDVDPQEMI